MYIYLTVVSKVCVRIQYFTVKKVTFDGFLIGLFPFLQFIEGSFEEYLKRLENPQVCSNLVIYFFFFVC